MSRRERVLLGLWLGASILLVGVIAVRTVRYFRGIPSPELAEAQSTLVFLVWLPLFLVGAARAYRYDEVPLSAGGRIAATALALVAGFATVSLLLAAGFSLAEGQWATWAGVATGGVGFGWLTYQLSRAACEGRCPRWTLIRASSPPEHGAAADVRPGTGAA